MNPNQKLWSDLYDRFKELGCSNTILFTKLIYNPEWVQRLTNEQVFCIRRLPDNKLELSFLPPKK